MTARLQSVVAVVDDDERILESLEDLLESAGFSARTFGSAEAFLRSDAVREAACLISEIRMPAIDGWELERRVSRERPDLPVILVTGQEPEQPGADLSAAPARVAAIFRKPFDGPALLAAVARAVERGS